MCPDRPGPAAIGCHLPIGTARSRPAFPFRDALSMPSIGGGDRGRACCAGPAPACSCLYRVPRCDTVRRKKKGPISTAPRGGWSDLSGLESDASMDASPFFSASATTTEACVVAGSCTRHKTTLGGCFVHKTNTEREHRSVSEFQSPQGDSC